MAHDVFISYSSEDKAIADAMCHYLEQDGIRCWIAPRDVRPGAEYAGEIIDALSASRAFVLVFSGHANASLHVKNEVKRTVSHEIPIIPFRTQDVQPSKSMELFLGARHWLDAMTLPLEAHFQKLATHVKFLVTERASAAAPAAVATDRAGVLPVQSPAALPNRSGWRLAALALALILVAGLGAAVAAFFIPRGTAPSQPPATVSPAVQLPARQESAAAPREAPPSPRQANVESAPAWSAPPKTRRHRAAPAARRRSFPKRRRQKHNRSAPPPPSCRTSRAPCGGFRLRQ